jgi:O-antigen ligase
MSSSEHILRRPALPGGARARTRSRGSASLSVWMLLILVAGAWVVLVDGFTRIPELDTNAHATDALTYEPYVAAFIFAGVVFPLVMLHALRAGASKTEGIFLWFVLCTFTYSKDFSYMRVPGIPIYITDITLVILLVSLFVLPRLRMLDFRSSAIWALLAFVLMGTLALAKGLTTGQEVPRAFRDYAMAVYALFFLVGLYLVKSWAAIVRIAQITWLGAMLLCLNGIAWFIGTPVGQRRYIPFGIYIVIAGITLMLAVINRAVHPVIGWSLGLLFIIGLLVTNMRSIYVCFVFGAMLAVFGPGKVGKKVDLMRAVKALAVFVVIAALALAIFARTKVGAAYIERSTEELVSGLLHSEDDDNVQFRFLAWAEAFGRFAQSPWIGEGFGVPFVFELTDMDARPHNTFITVAYKMGLLGLAPFLFLLFQAFRKGWTAFVSTRGDPNGFVLYGLLLVQLILCAYGFFNLVIESPFLACIFWFNMGMTIRAAKLLRPANGNTALAV